MMFELIKEVVVSVSKSRARYLSGRPLDCAHTCLCPHNREQT